MNNNFIAISISGKIGHFIVMKSFITKSSVAKVVQLQKLGFDDKYLVATQNNVVAKKITYGDKDNHCNSTKFRRKKLMFSRQK